MDERASAERDIEARLDELEAESRRRRDELRSIAAELPAATSRRAIVRSMFRSLAEAPDKPRVAKRVALKVLRAPADAVRAVRGR